MLDWEMELPDQSQQWTHIMASPKLSRVGYEGSELVLAGEPRPSKKGKNGKERREGRTKVERETK
jgi:hypothetical protein